MPRLSDRLTSIAASGSDRLAALRAVRQLRAPQGAIGAGYIRAAVWDHLCGCRPSPVDDVDVLYHDPSDLSWDAETALETRLRDMVPGLPWSVRNQARMHIRNGDPPYRSVAHAMEHWLETPTCVALRLEDDDTFTVIAPFGLGDLFDRRIRPTPRGRQRLGAYRDRLDRKLWHEKWPGITVERG